MIPALPLTDAMANLIVQVGVLLLVLAVWWWVTQSHAPTGAHK